ncbi:hypothetical protein Tco_0722608 [Tanacetum coccineum]
MSTFVRCVGCGEPLYGHPCRWCTCERCGNDLRDGYCFLCHSRNRDSFTCDSTPNSFDNPLDFSYPPLQPQYVPYSCELCGNNAHYGYDCPPQVSFVYNQDPCFNQNFDYFPQTSPIFSQQYPCCEDCGAPHETFQCQPMNYYEPNPCYDSNYSSFDQIEPLQFLIIHQPPQETSMEIFLDRENLMQSIETFLKKFDRISFREKLKVLLIAWDIFCEIKHTCRDKQQQELLCKLLKDVQNVKEELAKDINTPNWDHPAFYYDDDDDDDEESSIPLRDIIISRLPPCVAITPVLSTKELVDSLLMEDEHLDTMLAMKSDEVIKSSVEDLVPILSESEGIPDNMCDVPFHNNSLPLHISKDQVEDFYESNDDSTWIDDDSFSIDDIDYVEASPPHSELVSLEVVKDFHPEDGELKDDVLREKLSKINLLIAKIEALKDNPTPSSDFVTKSPSTSPNSFLEETNISYNSLPESETFCFNLEEKSSGNPTSYTDLSLPDYEALCCDSEPDSGDFTMDSFVIKSPILVEDGDSFLEKFKTTPELETFKFDIEEKNNGNTTIHADISLPDLECVYFKSEPDLGDLTSIDPGILENVSSTTNVKLPFEDEQSPLFAYVVWIFLSFLMYLVVPLYLLEQSTIFYFPASPNYHSFIWPGVYRVELS